MLAICHTPAVFRGAISISFLSTVLSDPRCEEFDIAVHACNLSILNRDIVKGDAQTTLHRAIAPKLKTKARKLQLKMLRLVNRTGHSSVDRERSSLRTPSTVEV